jgi:hypothetical protein
LRFAGRFVSSRWLCVRWRSPSYQSLRLPHGLIMALGGTLMRISPDDIWPIAITGTLRAGRVGKPAWRK